MQTYETDIVAWSQEQAGLTHARCFGRLDLEHIAEEIEDVSKSEPREFASRMAVLLRYLLKWQYQPVRRGASCEKTIKAQRKELAYNLTETTSLRAKLQDPDWLDMIWARAVALAVTETGLDCFPDTCDWSMDNEMLNPSWWPE